MFELRPLSHEAVGEALDKAVRYRLLNEPLLAESICLDILTVEPEHRCRSARGVEEIEEGSDRGGLARSVRPQEPEHLADADLQVEIDDPWCLPVELAETLGLDHCLAVLFSH